MGSCGSANPHPHVKPLSEHQQGPAFEQAKLKRQDAAGVSPFVVKSPRQQGNHWLTYGQIMIDLLASCIRVGLWTFCGTLDCMPIGLLMGVKSV